MRLRFKLEALRLNGEIVKLLFLALFLRALEAKDASKPEVKDVTKETKAEEPKQEVRHVG